MLSVPPLCMFVVESEFSTAAAVVSAAGSADPGSRCAAAVSKPAE